MTREDEIKKQAEKKAHEPSRLMHPYANQYKVMSAYEIGFIEGAVWADRTMIDKACEWLDYHLTFNVAEWDEGYTTQRVVDKFRKAMEGGE